MGHQTSKKTKKKHYFKFIAQFRFVNF